MRPNIIRWDNIRVNLINFQKLVVLLTLVIQKDLVLDTP